MVAALARVGARSYQVEILNAAGDLLWARPAVAGTDTAVVWPQDLDLAPGRYFWRVIADRESSTSSATALADFELLSAGD